MRTRKVQDARSHFGLETGPQRVEKPGGRAVVVVAEDQWNRINRDLPSFGKLLANCPLEEGDLPERHQPRETDHLFE
jgi:hypothetical protein